MKLRLNQKYILLLGVSHSLVTANVTVCSNDGTSNQKSEKILSLAQRLKIGIDDSQRKFLRDRNGVKIFYPKSTKSFVLPIVRIGEVEINASVEIIAAQWEEFQNRKDWDESVADTQLINLDGKKVAYIQQRAIFPIPSRDFSFSMHKLPGGVLGINDFRVIAFINVDDSNSIVQSWKAIRGKTNSILVLRPVGFNKTLVTQVIEVSPGGWIFNVFGIADACAGDNVVNSLSFLKKSIESTEEEESSQLSVEEAAQKRMQKNKAKKEQAELSIVEDVTVEKEDLLATVALLQRKLKELQATEVSQGMDLSALRKRVESDLKNTTERLKRMK